MKKNNNSQKTVYNFISPIKMKFKPATKASETQIKPLSVFSKITSFSWMTGSTKSDEAQKQYSPASIVPGSPIWSPLKFIKKLTNQHFLVGNEYKVDIMHLGGIVDDFIDTEYIWSMDFKKGIINVAVDLKKCLLAFLFSSEVQIYQFNFKKSQEIPTLVTTIKTSGQVRFIQFAKYSFLALFYKENIDFYQIDENMKNSKKKYSKKYNQPQGATLLQVPQAFEGVINIFFTQPKVDTSMFHLWNLEIKLEKDQIVMGSFRRIYDIPNGLKSKIVLSNYCKQIFCMNLGHQILAVRKGYIIDTVNSNIENNVAVLRYLGNDRLIHVLSHKVQLYRFSINMMLSPPRIVLESIDSIWSRMNDENYVFLEVLEMLNDNIVVFYQVSEKKNKSSSGEIKYAFVVTQKVKLEDKVKSILPSPQDLLKFKDNQTKRINNSDIELIQEKVDMAIKMGLTKREIYLRLWNNSSKCDIVDYQFLLNTMDYNTIRAQIENKLKKKSMVLREIIKIEEGCISMLQNKAFSHEACSQSLKNYLISHFLLRKLKLYQMFTLIQKNDLKIKKYKTDSTQPQNQQSQTILINIKDYVGFAKCDLKAMLLQLIRELCINNKDTVLKIRTLVKLFKFSFRPIYSHLLQDIVKEAGVHLLFLLQTIPEVLPYEHVLTDETSDAALYEGIWGRILPQEWDSNSYAGGISNIYNKEIVQEMKKSIWAKRFFLTLHDLLPYQKAEILEIHERNKAEQTFYNFIEKVFHYIKDKEVLQQLIEFVENNYEKLPRHLVGHIFLYKALYDYLQKQNALKPMLQKGQLNEFLGLRDFEIFKLIFDLEKRKKNCILKDVKEGIYSCGQLVAGGSELFNLALLNFFSSDLAGISDIKYLLNRLNNEKYEFHSQNQGMYEVIVKGMQAKLYLGSDHDIPIDQVYIYIINIHIDPASEIKNDLKYLRIINKHSQKFRKVKLNMSVFQIIRQVQKVIRKLISFEVEESKLFEKQSDSQILQKSLEILDQTQKVKKEIYFQAQLNRSLVIFIYLTKVLEQTHFIKKVNTLIHSQQLCQRYNIDELLIENAVIYMYKKKFSEDNIYKHNQTYIKQLLSLLPQNNQTRLFIAYEIQLGITLSCCGNEIQYPLGGSNAVLSTVELESAINCLPGETIKSIDFNRIYEISLRMQQISSDGKISSITLYQIYEIVILRLLECRMIKDSIPFIRKIMELNPINAYNFIYPAMLIKHFSSELCDENRSILLTILTYQFGNPDELLDVVENLLNAKCTSLEQKIILRGQLKKIQSERRIFEKGNPVLVKDYVEAIHTAKEQMIFAQILRKTLSKVMQMKEQFSKNLQYTIIYTILLNKPYGIVKYLYCSRYQTKFKGIRCFLSYLFKQQIFNKTCLLQLGKRIFKILHEGLSQTDYIQNVIGKYQEIPLVESIEISKIKSHQNLGAVMSKCVQRFKSKLKEELNLNKKRKAIQQTLEQRRERIAARLSLQSTQSEQYTNEYPFFDSDNQLTGQQTRLEKIITSKSTHVEFDPIFETQLLLTRKSRILGMYLSQQHSAQEKAMFYLMKFQLLEMKNSVVKLRNKKMEMENEYCLRMSARKCSQQASFNNNNNSSSSAELQPTLKCSDSAELAQIIDFTTLNIVNYQPQQKQVRPNILIRTIMGTLENNQQTKLNAESSTTEEIKLIEDLQPIVQSQHSTILLDTIVNKIHQLSDGENYNISPIQQSQLNEEQFKQLISHLYHSQKFTPTQAIAIFTKLSATNTPCPINKDMLQAFVKMDTFQKKFTLQIDFKHVFPIEGLFIQSKDLNQLFLLSKDKIIQTLNQSNVYKINKVLSLVFKNNEIQQQLNVVFLINLLQQLQINTDSDPKLLKMQKEKIKAFTEKISPHQLNQKDQDILNIISNQEMKKEMVNTIVQTMRRKKNSDMAQSFIQKWNQ